MAKSRPPYPAAFREQMLELVRAGKTPAELAREFECTAQTIANWIAQESAASGKAATQPPVKDGLTRLEREELVRLRRENRQLKTERDILAKATAWFARSGETTSKSSSNS